MIETRPHGGFGATRNRWLASLHHFSFAGYQNAERDGFGGILAVNHTVLAPRGELRPYPIDGTDVLLFVRRGVVEHSGYFEAGGRTVAGEVRLISTAAGVELGCHNPGSCPAEFIEIRLRATAPIDRPTHDVTAFPTRDHKGRLVTLASGFGENRAAMRMRARARLSAARLKGGDALTWRTQPRLHGYVLCASGALDVNGVVLDARDAAAVHREELVRLRAVKGSEILLIETD